MKCNESWKKFEKTGDVRAYLNYTACTREEKPDRHKEKVNDSDNNSDGTCVSDHAHRRL